MLTTSMRTLQSLELFSACKRSALKRIDQLGFTLDVVPGQVLCAEGAPGAEFFVLVDGLCDVRAPNGMLALLHPGAWFGETALLEDTTRKATVTARTNGAVLVYDKRAFTSLLMIAPNVSARLQRTSARVIEGKAPTAQPWYQRLPRAATSIRIAS